MWKLKHSKKDHQEHYVFVGEDFVVGRKDATLLIANDPSVSRRHAVLFVKHPEGNLSDSSKKSSLFLRDEGSKYGTFKNGVRVNAEVELQNNDLVKFGQFESEYRIHNLPLVVTTSCLEVSSKKELRKTVHFLGGSLISEWQPSCTHLVMTEVKVTVKALCCLVSAKPIVKPEYFQELKRSLKSSATVLSPDQFVPPIGEALIDKDVVSFNVNLQRKTIFKDKTFFFLDEKQFKKLHLGIMLGGGNASILSTDNIKPDILLRDGCCIIEPMQATQEFGSMLSSVRSILQKKEYRMIPESDIGLSVTYCSTDKFCNPQFNMVETLLSQKMQSQTLTQREVYVPDTQERTARVENRSRNPVSDFSSLHLSSFQKDPVENMGVSEVPLSAQIKQELDGIFDDPFESKVDSPSRVDSLATTVPLPTPKRLSEQETINDNGSRISLSTTRPLRGKRATSRGNENLIPNKVLKQERDQTEKIPIPEINSPPRRNGTTSSNKVKQSTNFNSSPEKKPEVPFRSLPSVHTNGFHTDEVDLPQNLAKIEFASLICRKPAPVVECNRNSTIKNFKKFKKVQPRKAQTLPRIIGSHQLVAFDKVAAEIADANWDEPLDPEEESQPVKGEFDW